MSHEIYAASAPRGPMRGLSLLLFYSVFAIVATVANLLTQRMVLAVTPPEWRAWQDGLPALAVAIFIGTLVGLVVKYLLDKRWIFADTSAGAANHGRKFGLYALMGVATTVIFWGAEIIAWWIWKTHVAREIGAILGLLIGYIVKYQLDKRFVFTKGQG